MIAGTRCTFGTTDDFAKATRTLAAHQGPNNGFLAAGLIWAVLIWAGLAGATTDGRPLAIFFLSCVLVASLYGAATTPRRILFIQALPAALTLVALALVAVLARV